MYIVFTGIFCHIGMLYKEFSEKNVNKLREVFSKKKQNKIGKFQTGLDLELIIQLDTMLKRETGEELN